MFKIILGILIASILAFALFFVFKKSSINHSKTYPKYLMKDILWNFNHPPYESQQEFIDALVKYNQEITGIASLKTDEVAIEAPQLFIQYSHWDEDSEDIIEPSFLIRADNGKFFTQGELLYKVHHEVWQKLMDEDHKFFEGFSLWEGKNPDHPNLPLYFLKLGS